MRKALRRLAFVLVALVALLAFGAFIPRPLWPQNDSGHAYRVLVLSNPIHTDIAIPVDARVLATFDGLVKNGIQADLPGVRYLLFGWGGRSFYLNTPTWADLKAGPLLKGLTLDASVMHVDIAGDIAEPQSFVTGLDVGEAEFQRLLDFIAASFTKGPDGPIRIPDVAYGAYDGFFEANGRFTAILGCNTWTARALRQAGLRTGWWNPLPQSLALSLRLYN